MPKELPYKTFILYVSKYRRFWISYAKKDEYLTVLEELELPPHYNEEQQYRAVQRHMVPYMLDYIEADEAKNARDWADLELKKICWALAKKEKRTRPDQL